MKVNALKWAKALFVLWALYGAQMAWSCPDQQDWKGFSAIEISLPNTSLMKMKRFSDGLLIQFESERGVQEMLQLDRGLILYKGFPPEKLRGPSPFSMASMPVGAALGFLGRQFKSPCDIDTTETKVDFDAPGNSGKVTGSVQRREEPSSVSSATTVLFDLVAVRPQKPGAGSRLAGRVEFSAFVPVQKDLPLAGWTLVRGDGITTKQTIQVFQGTETLDALEVLPLEEWTPSR